MHNYFTLKDLSIEYKFISQWIYQFRSVTGKCIFLKVVKFTQICIISPKLEHYGANTVYIRNQRPRIDRNKVILVEKAEGVVNSFEIYIIYLVSILIVITYFGFE